MVFSKVFCRLHKGRVFRGRFSWVLIGEGFSKDEFSRVPSGEGFSSLLYSLGC